MGSAPPFIVFDRNARIISDADPVAAHKANQKKLLPEMKLDRLGWIFLFCQEGNGEQLSM
jgi:hypothetical protein